MKGHKDFKISFYPAISKNSTEFSEEYDTLLEAVAVLEAVANYTLMLHECSLMPDHSNTGMLFKNTPSEWVEVGDDGLAI